MGSCREYGLLELEQRDDPKCVQRQALQLLLEQRQLLGRAGGSGARSRSTIVSQMVLAVSARDIGDIVGPKSGDACRNVRFRSTMTKL